MLFKSNLTIKFIFNKIQLERAELRGRSAELRAVTFHALLGVLPGDVFLVTSSLAAVLSNLDNFGRFSEFCA